MHKHIIYTQPDGAVEVIGLDYFNLSDVRKWTRPGELIKRGPSSNPDPQFIEPDGTELTLANGGLQCPADDLLFADGAPVCNESTADFIERVILRHVPHGVVPKVLDVRKWKFQPDRTFREAWTMGAGRTDVDMPKARIIHMGRIREARDAELAKLDVPYLKALETGDTIEQSRIAALKQELRDLPATFNLSTAKTPETLKSRWPEIIPR